MNRRAARLLVPIRLVVVSLTVAVAAVLGTGAATAVASTPAPTPPPVVTANEFLPDERNLSECVGVLERPGCGSQERGGPAQTVVFVVMLGAMALIFTRIAIGVRQNRAALDATMDAPERVDP